MEKIYTIPIYDCVLRVIVAQNVYAARDKYKHLFGPYDERDFDALCLRSGGPDFALLFTPASARRMDVVAHEVFHLTHRILEWAGIEFTEENHEAGSLLCGYLMKLVMEAIETKKGKK